MAVDWIIKPLVVLLVVIFVFALYAQIKHTISVNDITEIKVDVNIFDYLPDSLWNIETKDVAIPSKVNTDMDKHNMNLNEISGAILFLDVLTYGIVWFVLWIIPWICVCEICGCCWCIKSLIRRNFPNGLGFEQFRQDFSLGISILLSMFLWLVLITKILYVPHFEDYLFLTIVLYGLYMYQCTKSPTLKYLNNILTIHDVEIYFMKIRQAPPKIIFEEDVYTSKSNTYERIEVTKQHGMVVNERSLGSFTETDWEYSHTNEHQYQYTHWRDLSCNYINFNTFKALRLKFTKEITFGNDAAKAHFTKMNNESSRIRIELDGFKSDILMSQGNNWKYDITLYWIFCIIGCSVLYRLWFAIQVPRKQINFVKDVTIL